VTLSSHPRHESRGGKAITGLPHHRELYFEGNRVSMIQRLLFTSAIPGDAGADLWSDASWLDGLPSSNAQVIACSPDQGRTRTNRLSSPGICAGAKGGVL
jgi:hypothetical protein